MAWSIGLDEAGYGPNLGPLLQTAVALELPEDDRGGWATLAPWVRQAHERADGRILVDDSKKVHGGSSSGVGKLEAGVFAFLGGLPKSLEQFLTEFALPGTLADLNAEDWFVGQRLVPKETIETLKGPRVMARVRVVTTPVFNALVQQSNSKGVVLARGVQELLPAILADLPSDELPAFILGDKQGGRNSYAGILADTFPTGWVVADIESAATSEYRILNLGRPVDVAFRPRADSASAAVALASMVAKYLREVFMEQFNTYWAKYCPGIGPTAGYPLDARRFYEEIRPVMEALGTREDAVWRSR
ncbi:MAG: hypothetical protein ACRCZF_10610 [Gemmataceae bacterium]